MENKKEEKLGSYSSVSSVFGQTLFNPLKCSNNEKGFIFQTNMMAEFEIQISGFEDKASSSKSGQFRIIKTIKQMKIEPT